jgi:hypothetical protein
VTASVATRYIVYAQTDANIILEWKYTTKEAGKNDQAWLDDPKKLPTFDPDDSIGSLCKIDKIEAS